MEWNHRWFGFWKEDGPAYAACPSIHDHRFPDVVARYDTSRIRRYLTQSFALTATSRNGRPCPVTGRKRFGSLGIMTDGAWLWRDDLPDFIEEFQVALPDQFLLAMAARDFAPQQDVDPDLIPGLPWPPISGALKSFVLGGPSGDPPPGG